MAFMHNVLALIGKLVVSVVFMLHFYISSKRVVTIPGHNALTGLHLLIISPVILAIFI